MSITITGGVGIGTISSGPTGPLPISEGGTGQITAPLAINALLPSQDSHPSGILGTDGTDLFWSLPGGTFTGGSVTGASTFQSPIRFQGSLTLATGWSDKRNSPAFSSTPDIDCSIGNNYVVTLTGNITAITFSNIPTVDNAYTLTLFLTQDATGSRTIVWPSYIKWEDSIAPVLTTVATKTDIFQLTTDDGGVTWYGTTVGLNF